MFELIGSQEPTKFITAEHELIHMKAVLSQGNCSVFLPTPGDASIAIFITESIFINLIDSLHKSRWNVKL